LLARNCSSRQRRCCSGHLRRWRDGLQRGVDDPLAVETYLGNPVTTGPGAVVRFSPFGTEARYPLGIFAAVAGLFVLLRR
jgi:hypothetical protein